RPARDAGESAPAVIRFIESLISATGSFLNLAMASASNAPAFQDREAVPHAPTAGRRWGPTQPRAILRHEFRGPSESRGRRGRADFRQRSENDSPTSYQSETAMNMKQDIRCASAVSVALVLSTAYAAGDTQTAQPMTGKEKATAIGAGTGAVAGAVVGGPVGAVVGAGVGAYVGNKGTDAHGQVGAQHT